MIAANLSKPPIEGIGIDIAKSFAFSLGLALLCWRLAVNRSILLAKEVHRWAVETQEDPAQWTSHPADASALFAPWIPKDKMIIRRSWNKVRRRVK